MNFCLFQTMTNSLSKHKNIDVLFICQNIENIHENLIRKQNYYNHGITETISKL